MCYSRVPENPEDEHDIREDDLFVEGRTTATAPSSPAPPCRIEIRRFRPALVQA